MKRCRFSFYLLVLSVLSFYACQKDMPGVDTQEIPAADNELIEFSKVFSQKFDVFQTAAIDESRFYYLALTDSSTTSVFPEFIQIFGNEPKLSDIEFGEMNENGEVNWRHNFSFFPQTFIPIANTEYVLLAGSVNKQGVVALFNTQTRTVEQEYLETAPKSAYSTIAILPDGTYRLAGISDNHVLITDFEINVLNPSILARQSTSFLKYELGFPKQLLIANDELPTSILSLVDLQLGTIKLIWLDNELEIIDADNFSNVLSFSNQDIALNNESLYFMSSKDDPDKKKNTDGSWRSLTIRKFDLKGVETWQKKVSLSGKSDVSYSIFFAEDRLYFIGTHSEYCTRGGVSDSYSCFSNALIGKLSTTNGKLLSYRTFSNENNPWNTTRGATGLTMGEQIIVFGYTDRQENKPSSSWMMSTNIANF